MIFIIINYLTMKYTSNDNQCQLDLLKFLTYDGRTNRIDSDSVSEKVLLILTIIILFHLASPIKGRILYMKIRPLPYYLFLYYRNFNFCYAFMIHLLHCKGYIFIFRYRPFILFWDIPQLS